MGYFGSLRERACDRIAAGAVLLACIVPASPLGASEPHVFRDWAVDCDGSPILCILSQTASSPDDNLWLGTVRLHPAQDGGANIVVLVPAGVHLGSGIFVGTAQPLTSITFQTCTKAACTASGRIDRNELARWRRGTTAQLRYRPAITSPPVSFAVSLMGISAALQYVTETES